MSGKLAIRDLGLEQAYVTGTSDLFTSFYLPCLAVATKYDRAVGYFRSSLFVLAGLAFSDFARRGGSARIVCSNRISADDADAIQRGLGWRAAAEHQLDASLREVLENPEDAPVAQFLATLVAARILELRVAIRPSNPGIFHDKVGILRDAINDAVSFVGSANETLSAWDPRLNHEGFEVFRSWGGESDATRVARHIEYFERLWAGTHPGISTLELPEAAKRRLLDFQDPEGFESAALKVRRHLRAEEALPWTTAPPGVRPPPPARRVLQEHQQAVVESWERAGNRGIITHVTGAGKTVSALEIIRRWTSKNRPALVLVPSQLLLEQWRSEIAREFDESEINVLAVGGDSGRPRWGPQLGDFTRSTGALGRRVVVATIQTASRDHFLKKLHAGEHLLVVGDEVHRVGAPGYRAILSAEKGAALGLSATPQRYGDPDGTRAIFEFFGDALKPEVGIGEAVRLGRLVPYDYFVHRVSLSETERSQWEAISEEIARVFASLPRDESGAPRYTERYRLLLIRRARIVKQAASKIDLARDVVTREYKTGERWLVYCDDSAQLRAVADVLRACSLPVYEYHSAMQGSRDSTMTAFSTHGGVLVAIKCLDEGVDLPTVSRALILASSSNPREFIQRRGRVLRVAPDKFSAAIHDALVLPDQDSTSGASVPSFVRTDLARALEFARHARNTAVFMQLRLCASEFGLRPEDIILDSFEDEDDSHA